MLQAAASKSFSTRARLAPNARQSSPAAMTQWLLVTFTVSPTTGPAAARQITSGDSALDCVEVNADGILDRGILGAGQRPVVGKAPVLVCESKACVRATDIADEQAGCRHLCAVRSRAVRLCSQSPAQDAAAVGDYRSRIFVAMMAR